MALGLSAWLVSLYMCIIDPDARGPWRGLLPPGFQKGRTNGSVWGETGPAEGRVEGQWDRHPP